MNEKHFHCVYLYMWVYVCWTTMAKDVIHEAIREKPKGTMNLFTLVLAQLLIWCPVWRQRLELSNETRGEEEGGRLDWWIKTNCFRYFYAASSRRSSDNWQLSFFALYAHLDFTLAEFSKQQFQLSWCCSSAAGVGRMERLYGAEPILLIQSKVIYFGCTFSSPRDSFSFSCLS